MPDLEDALVSLLTPGGPDDHVDTVPPGTPPDARRTAAATVARLVRTELRLVLREPLVLAFVLAFPVVTVLVLAGSFAAEDAVDFDGVEPAQWYVASYLAVVIAAIGLVMVPVHVAAYRERGVLRRFAAAGFPSWSFAVASLVVGVALTLLGAAVLLAVAAPLYGLPPVHGSAVDRRRRPASARSRSPASAC